MMKRTQIQVPEDEYAELERLAHQLGRSVADCIREGIDLFLGKNRATNAGLDKIAGRFHPQSIEDLKPHDRGLVESLIRSGRRRKR